MSDEWFDQHVYMLVVIKSIFRLKSIKEAKSHKTILLPPWSPFGALLKKI